MPEDKKAKITAVMRRVLEHYAATGVREVPQELAIALGQALMS
jgi:hypothetical protein